MERTLNAYITTKQIILRPTVVIHCSCLQVISRFRMLYLVRGPPKIGQTDRNHKKIAYSIASEFTGPKFRFRISAIPTLAIRYGLDDSILF